MRERTFYWLLCKDPEDGNPFLIKGGNTEQEARQKGLEMLGGLDFEVRGLRTTNLGTASAMIRGTRLEDTHDLHRSRQRLGHDRSLRRFLQRRSP